MFSSCREALLAAALALSANAAARELVVCADPDNPPYSGADRSGFENRIAQVVADEMGADLRYQWQPLRRGVVRKTLDARACDILVGVPAGLERVTTTVPYYRSGFAFVYRRGTAPFESFDDPRLRAGRVGVQLVGVDMAATPAALALARRGIVDNIVGFPVYGAEPSARRMIEAVARGDLEVAVIWGPQAGYFVKRARAPLAMSLASDPDDPNALSFAIAMAVRQGDTALRDELDAALRRSRDRIATILADFGVPTEPFP